MRPATTKTAVWIGLAVAGLSAARISGTIIARDRCIAAARAIPFQAAAAAAGPGKPGGTVGEELSRLAPGGHWILGERRDDGSRSVTWRAASGNSVDWEWSCRDEETVPTLSAESKNARALTPERVFE